MGLIKFIFNLVIMVIGFVVVSFIWDKLKGWDKTGIITGIIRTIGIIFMVIIAIIIMFGECAQTFRNFDTPPDYDYYDDVRK